MQEEKTGVAGCTIQYSRNHEGFWTAFPRIMLSEMADGLRSDECLLLASALQRASQRVSQMNANDSTNMLFEGRPE